MLTAAAVIVGASVILFDRYSELALSLMAGEIASTLLSRMAVPVLYYMQKNELILNFPSPARPPKRKERVGVREINTEETKWKQLKCR